MEKQTFLIQSYIPPDENIIVSDTWSNPRCVVPLRKESRIMSWITFAKQHK